MTGTPPIRILIAVVAALGWVAAVAAADDRKTTPPAKPRAEARSMSAPETAPGNAAADDAPAATSTDQSPPPAPETEAESSTSARSDAGTTVPLDIGGSVTVPAPGVTVLEGDQLAPGGKPIAHFKAPATDRDDKDEATTWGALKILVKKVKPGTRRELKWTAGQSFAGSAIDTPVVVVRGHQRGPTLCLTAAVHGDELNGVEIVRRVLADLDADKLSGTVIAAPIVNLLGFSRGSRYLPDRRDLNRYFPGSTRGSSASRIAFVFFNKVIRHCDRLVDFHTGSFKRTNLPQLRANLKVPAVRKFVSRFGATSVVHNAGRGGTLRNAAVSVGIPAVAFELGEPGTLQLDAVAFGVKAIDTLLDKLDMVDRFRLWSEPQPIFYRSRWLRAYRGGILTSNIAVGSTVKNGDVLGLVINPVTNEKSEILSPFDGRLLGRALNQFVLPGFATFHIGIESSERQNAEIVLADPDPHDVDTDDGSDDADSVDAAPDARPQVRAVIDEIIDDIDEEMH